MDSAIRLREFSDQAEPAVSLAVLPLHCCTIVTMILGMAIYGKIHKPFNPDHCIHLHPVSNRQPAASLVADGEESGGMGSRRSRIKAGGV